jgi:hypothetical protein
VIAGRSMPIQRSWLRTAGWMLIMLVLLGLATFTGLLGNYLLAGVFAFFGLLSLTGIGSGSYITACPVCSKQLRGLLGLKRCPQCLSYGQVSEGQYYELTPDFVAKTPLLSLPLGEQRKMPPLCCACGAPADRTERLRIIRLEFAFDLDVPHCTLHTGGADLDAITVPGKSKAQSPVLKVKSYAFYLACIKMNYPSLANMHANGNISNQTVLISTT